MQEVVGSRRKYVKKDHILKLYSEVVYLIYGNVKVFQTNLKCDIVVNFHPCWK